MKVKEHLEELKKELFYLFIPLVVSFIFFFILSKKMILFLLNYYEIPLRNVVSLTPLESIQTSLSIAGTLTLLFIIPLTLNGMFRFSKEVIGEKIYKKSKGLILKSYLLGIFGLFMGVFVFSKLILNNLLTSYTITNASWSILSVFSLIIKLGIAMAIGVQLILIIPSLINIGLVKKDSMKSLRPIVLVMVLIISAIVTPPDVISMFLMSLPIYVSYEAGMLLSKLQEVKQI